MTLNGTAAQAATWAGSFWGAGDRGFDVLVSKLRDGKHTCEAILEMYQKRIEIEQEYAAKLSNLAKLPIANNEFGTLRDAVEEARAELETMSKARSDVVRQMKAQLESPLATLIVNQSSARKSLQSAAEKELKAKQSALDAAARTRQTFERKVAEWNAAVADKSRKPPSQSEYDQLQQLKGDCDAAVAKAQEAHARWRDDWRNTCDQFQRLEADRVDFLRSSLWNYANVFSTVCVADDEGCERVRLALEKCDIDAELGAFARARGTGADVPAAPSYKPLTISPVPIPPPAPAPAAAPAAAPPTTKGPETNAGHNVICGPPSDTAPAGEDDGVFDYDPYDLSIVKPVLFYVRVLFNYAPQAPEELQIGKGQFIPVVDTQEDGWWEGEVPDEKGRKRRGLFPSNFVERVAGPSS